MKKLIIFTLIGFFLISSFLFLFQNKNINKNKNEDFEKNKIKKIILISQQNVLYKDLNIKLEMFINEDFDESNILLIKTKIIDYFAQNNISLESFDLVNASPNDGILIFYIEENKKFKINIYNNKYTSSEKLKQTFENLNNKQVLKKINFLNKNPFRNLNSVYSKDSLDLYVNDLFPFKFFIGSDNTGIYNLDQTQFYLGFNLNNAFGLDSNFSYQLLTDYNLNNFIANTCEWKIFLPWNNILTFFVNYTSLKSNSNLPTLLNKRGFFAQGTIQYDIILPNFLNIQHDLIFGFDFKRTDTTLNFSEVEIIDDDPANLTQFLLSYDLNYINKIYNAELKISNYFSPLEFFKNQENINFQRLRPFAESIYFYSKIQFLNSFKFYKNYLLCLFFTGQYSNNNLLYSETLHVGGFNSVRGYYESELNGDLGFIFNGELRTPFLKILKIKKENGIQLILFYDLGIATKYKITPLEDKSKLIYGYGPGLRLKVNPYFDAHVDLGFKGVKKMDLDNKNYLIHFEINFSY